MEERLQKIIAHWGIASRRQAEQMIQAGRVRVNGIKAVMGQKANPSRDCIEVDGQPIQPHQRPQPVYILLNKPPGIVSTCDDPQGRLKVMDLLPRAFRKGQGIHPVGRLDADSTGALLLTNDGELTFHLTHPRHHISKTYQVWVEGCPPEATLQIWRQGVILSGRKTLPATVRRIGSPSRGQTQLEVVLVEGRNRQIRRVAEQLGHPVKKLHRIAIGSIQLNCSGQPKLPQGQYRLLTEPEIRCLKQESQLTSIQGRETAVTSSMCHYHSC
jgi:23S rRNA pseudouridine2605 synthase